MYRPIPVALILREPAEPVDTGDMRALSIRQPYTELILRGFSFRSVPHPWLMMLPLRPVQMLGEKVEGAGGVDRVGVWRRGAPSRSMTASEASMYGRPTLSGCL